MSKTFDVIMYLSNKVYKVIHQQKTKDICNTFVQSFVKQIKYEILTVVKGLFFGIK